MTPLPKRRLSTRRQGKRRAALKLDSVGLSVCPNCQKPFVPHTICQNCGYYNGKQVLTIKPKKADDRP